MFTKLYFAGGLVNVIERGETCGAVSAQGVSQSTSVEAVVFDTSVYRDLRLSHYIDDLVMELFDSIDNLGTSSLNICMDVVCIYGVAGGLSRQVCLRDVTDDVRPRGLLHQGH
ncbi:MAG: hypothetical protein ACKPKO_01660, partial [Candidatus Fonsibacter sp.]